MFVEGTTGQLGVLGRAPLITVVVGIEALKHGTVFSLNICHPHLHGVHSVLKTLQHKGVCEYNFVVLGAHV